MLGVSWLVRNSGSRSLEIGGVNSPSMSLSSCLMLVAVLTAVSDASVGTNEGTKRER